MALRYLRCIGVSRDAGTIYDRPATQIFHFGIAQLMREGVEGVAGEGVQALERWGLAERGECTDAGLTPVSSSTFSVQSEMRRSRAF